MKRAERILAAKRADAAADTSAWERETGERVDTVAPRYPARLGIVRPAPRLRVARPHQRAVWNRIVFSEPAPKKTLVNKVKSLFESGRGSRFVSSGLAWPSLDG